MLKRIGAVLILVGIALVVPTAPAIAAVPAGLKYVALGDSYSAGFGLLPLASDSPDGCYRAADNYPHQVAAALSLDLTDVTCSGAVTANITTPPGQVTMTGFGPLPIQGEALDADTDIVTVTIGGNDLGFADVAEFCIVPVAGAGPIGAPTDDNCREHYVFEAGGVTVDELADRLEFVVSLRLAETMQYIKAQAPNARVFVVGYPQIAPTFAHSPTGCYSPAVGPSGLEPPFPQNTVPYTTVDLHYLNHIEDLMDQYIQEAAGFEDFTYIPTWAATAGHTVCDPEPYIFGIGLTNDPSDGTPTPLDGIYAKLGALHPNTTGVQFLAQQVIDAIQAHPDFADAAPGPTLPATGPQPAALVGLAVALLGVGLVAVRRRGSRTADPR